MTIDIIGAGIGGLTTAIALHKKGIDTRLFEQAKEIKPVGAGIILANNAMQVYHRLGIRHEIEKNGNPISSMNILDQQFKPISKMNLKYFEDKYGVQNIAIHRGKLQQILASKLSGNLNLGFKLHKIEESDKGFDIYFENDVKLHSETLIGADGLKSTVRKIMLEEGQIRDASQICWRGIAAYDLPRKFQNELNEVWGHGDRIGFVKIDDQKVYWYALKTLDVKQQYAVEEIENYFEDYHPIVRELLKQTPKNTIHTANIKDLRPVKKWCTTNMCLLGDAAHATTPNLGQGACQAIEDAYYLADCISKNSVNVAFQKYQQIRMPKAHRIVKTSWALGKIAHWKNPIAVKLRNRLMILIPPKVNQKQSERIFELDIK